MEIGRLVDKRLGKRSVGLLPLIISASKQSYPFQHNPSRLDRDIWLARLSDLLIDGILISSRQSLDIHQWREKLRRGELQIEVNELSFSVKCDREIEKNR